MCTWYNQINKEDRFILQAKRKGAEPGMKKLLCLVLVLCMTPLFALADTKDVLNTESELPIVTEPITLSIFGKQGAIHAEWHEVGSSCDDFARNILWIVGQDLHLHAVYWCTA